MLDFEFGSYGYELKNKIWLQRFKLLSSHGETKLGLGVEEPFLSEKLKGIIKYLKEEWKVFFVDYLKECLNPYLKKEFILINN